MKPDPITNALDELRRQRDAVASQLEDLDEAIGHLEHLAPDRPERKTKTRKKAKKKRRKKKKSPHANNTGDRAELAKWRKKLLAPILKHENGTPERTKATDDLCARELTRPDGTKWRPSRSAILLWIRQAEE